MMKLINIGIISILFFAIAACSQVEHDLSTKDIPTKTYTVIFDANGGSGSMPNQTFNYDVTNDLIPNDFTRTDYTFCGWGIAPDEVAPDYSDCQSVKNLTPDKSITLYALWTEAGKITPVIFTPVPGKIDYADKVALSCAIDDVTIYYTTDGSSPTESSNKYTEPFAINSDTTLKVFAVKDGMKNSVITTANYTIKTYTVTFEDESGKLLSKISELKKNDTLKEEQFPQLTKIGYTFAGWYNDNGKFTSQSLISENIILTTKWTPNTYGVIFDANGGNGSMANQTFTYDVTSDLTANTFTKTNYTFYGWATEANKNSPDYTNKQSVKNLTTGNEITLYAVWIQNTTAANVANIITNLAASEEPYTIKVTGEITDDTIFAIRTALRTNNSIKIILDLSAVTGLKSIKEFAFENCSNLIGIILGDSFEEIKEYAFRNCNNLTNIIFGKNLETIGNAAFAYCNNLTSIILGDNIETIGNSTFAFCTSLTSITFDDALKTIESGAFSYCNNLTSVIFSDNIETIEDYCFTYCSGLTNITFGKNLEIIGDEAFAYCSSLTNITFGENLKKIGDEAFAYCSGLINIVFGDALETIGDEAFAYCFGLTNITFGENFETIEKRAFVNCLNLKFTVSDKNDFYSTSDDKKILLSKDKTVLVAYPSAHGSITIPTGVTGIGDYAFSYCTELSSVTIPESVTSIGNYAFSYCTGLSSVTIPDGTISISNTAFYMCSNLDI